MCVCVCVCVHAWYAKLLPYVCIPFCLHCCSCGLFCCCSFFFYTLLSASVQFKSASVYTQSRITDTKQTDIISFLFHFWNACECCWFLLRQLPWLWLPQQPVLHTDWRDCVSCSSCWNHLQQGEEPAEILHTAHWWHPLLVHPSLEGSRRYRTGYFFCSVFLVRCVRGSVLLLFVYLCVHDIIFVFEGYLSQCVYFEACSNLVPADAVLKTELKTILPQKSSNIISPVGQNFGADWFMWHFLISFSIQVHKVGYTWLALSNYLKLV